MKFDLKKNWYLWLVLWIGLIIILFWDKIKNFFYDITMTEAEKEKAWREDPNGNKDKNKTYHRRYIIWNRKVTFGQADKWSPIMVVMVEEKFANFTVIKWHNPKTNEWKNCNYRMTGEIINYSNCRCGIPDEMSFILEMCPEAFEGYTPEQGTGGVWYTRNIKVKDIPESGPLIQNIVNPIYKGKYIEAEPVGEPQEVRS